MDMYICIYMIYMYIIYTYVYIYDKTCHFNHF